MNSTDQGRRFTIVLVVCAWLKPQSCNSQYEASVDPPFAVYLKDSVDVIQTIIPWKTTRNMYEVPQTCNS